MPPVTLNCKESLTEITIDVAGVQKLLSEIKPHKANGPDDIPNLVLQNCASELAPGITCIFQKSLDSGTLPKDWTDANVTPVFKKGDRHIAENYRPVSLTSVLSKTLEHIVCHSMHAHFDQNNILTKVNHGFRAGYSCGTQLTIVVDDVAKNNHDDVQTDIGVLDLSKAFDTVPHDKLLHKLQCYGIRGNLHQWIQSFLCQRHMRVLVDGEASTEETVDSGVPQGTVLGPLLFLCHINDLPDVVTSHVRLFADDCLIYRHIRSNIDSEALQKDLKQLEKWAIDWGMTYNAKKCYILSVNNKGLNYPYQLNNHTLQLVESTPYLGVTLTKDLTWGKHINIINNKASSTLGLIRRNLGNCPQQCRKTAYTSLVRSIFQYASTVWDPYLEQDIEVLEKTQKKAARFITGNYHSREPGSMTQMLKELDLPMLKQRRKEDRLCLMYKIERGLVPAIPKDTYLKPIREKRKVKAKTFTDCETKNFVEKYQNLHSNCFEAISTPNKTYSNSFFPRTSSLKT